VRIAGAVALLAACAPAAERDAPAAAPVRAAVAGACSIEGWSIDPDPQGLRVRAGPSATARVVGRLPGFVRDDDGDYGPGFAIVGAQGGWLHIRDARDAWAPTPRATYRGAGWVHGSMVRVAVQSGTGRALPSPDAAALVDIGGEWLTEKGQVSAVTGCRGRWAKLRYALTAAPARGSRTGEAWFTGICGDQRTTCS
jgi:hypothetical protein